MSKHKGFAVFAKFHEKDHFQSHINVFMPGTYGGKCKERAEEWAKRVFKGEK